MLDHIIRGGRVIDGNAAQAFTADIGIKDGKIVEIGRITTPAAQELDADGATVTPGFIDIHSHYDGQFLWDDRLEPSFSHGVTTVLAGYCGVGFAPVANHRQALMELMEGVEDIPSIVLDEGLDWNWQSYPDYLDRLAERQYSMDVGSNIAHAPLRVFVMGERALNHEAATAEDIKRMSQLVREAMDAGAVGFSNGRITTHYSSRGNHVPGTFTDDAELLAIAKAVGDSGHGVIQIIPAGANGDLVTSALTKQQRLAEFQRIENLAAVSGRPVTFTVMEYSAQVDDLMIMVAQSANSAKNGFKVIPQIAPRGLGVVQMLDSYHLFLRRPTYRAIAHLPCNERAAAMRSPDVRQRILHEDNVDGEYAQNPALLGALNAQLKWLADSYILSHPMDYEPGPDRKVSALAQAAGKTHLEFIYDHFTEGDGRNYSVAFLNNYAQGSLDHVRRLFDDDGVIFGLADGGAHMRFICDASMPTFQMAFWGRDRTRGPLVPIEHIVKKLTADCADLYGFKDRGRLAIGQRADINVLDFPTLGLHPPHMVHDLPSGAGRLQQNSSGYIATLVKGEVTRLRDQDTGARPGRLLRQKS